MAGAVKHMERSHRSVSNKDYIFSRFHLNAKKVAQARDSRKTIGQRLASMLRKTFKGGK